MFLSFSMLYYLLVGKLNTIESISLYENSRFNNNEFVIRFLRLIFIWNGFAVHTVNLRKNMDEVQKDIGCKNLRYFKYIVHSTFLNWIKMLLCEKTKLKKFTSNYVDYCQYFISMDQPSQ